ncbi:glycosyltransferase family 2 protein [Candidatus Cryosericum septentrionale]|jgi:glycosyltransferase involved in cell wall biosynthesis|uniref:Glycosyltransferase family 2 protein n=1 Tax=Candidatus Cryosericum septentrionale TaxID=2290913 RepID=A0A398DXJ6_9BACT|nr:glycosyltransferase family 2 protein [Candidatus Cryosericum septentrionale]
MLVNQQNADRPIMSVIVCTLNRAHVLETVCLASLAVQELPGCVELIVCDASPDTATEAVMRQWGSTHGDWACTYVHATQRGLCSQRNQAIHVSHGDAVLFVDDDLELLPGALVALIQAFDRDSNCQYGGFECVRVLPLGAERSESATSRIAHRWFASFWELGSGEGPKRILPSGFNSGGASIDRETASALRREECQVIDVEWMSGCCMAFRASLFQEDGICFNERLARFGGYCLAEDVVVSLAVRRVVGLRLGLCSWAQAVHWEAPGGRGGDRSRWAARAYNHRIVWTLSGEPTLARRFSWLWGQIGSVVQCLWRRRMDRLCGLGDGWRAIRLDETQGHLPE